MRSRGAKGRVGPKPVLLLDECICAKTIIDALEQAGEEVHTVIGEYGRGRQDQEWLPDAGGKRYVVLTKDRAIRRTPLECAAVMDNRVLYFALTSGNMTGEQMAKAIVAALADIKGIVAGVKGRGAVMARISVDGRVCVLEARQ